MSILKLLKCEYGWRRYRWLGRLCRILFFISFYGRLEGYGIIRRL